MVSDMVCVLQNAGVDEAGCVGHDWGSQICYEMGRSRPDVINAIVGIAIPVCFFVLYSVYDHPTRIGGIGNEL